MKSQFLGLLVIGIMGAVGFKVLVDFKMSKGVDLPGTANVLEVIDSVESVEHINSGEFNRVLQQHWMRPTGQ